MNTWQFVPWIGGEDLSAAANVPELWGVRWFQHQLDTTQIAGVSTSYLVENNVDGYLYIGPNQIFPGAAGGLGQKLLAPYAAAIMTIDYNPVFLVSIAAGRDFTLPRTNPGSNAQILNPRGPSAYVAVTALPAALPPTKLPPLRSGYFRIYDWYDFEGNAASVDVAPGTTFGSERGDMTGATSIFGAVSGTASSNGIAVSLEATSPLGTNVILASASGTYSGAFQSVVQGVGTVGLGPFLAVSNTSGAAHVTLTDLLMVVGFGGGAS